MLKDKMLRFRVMELHKELVKSGQYMAARKVLRFLSEGQMCLSLGDVDFYLETQMEKLGCRIAYIGRRYTCHVYLKSV